MIRGKEAAVGFLAILGIVAALFGPQLLYNYSESGIEYNIYLESFNKNGDEITGSVRIKITNTNDFTVSVTQITISLFDPENDRPFFSTTDNGASMGAGSTIQISKAFDISYSEIPAYEVRIQLTAYVIWDGAGSWMNKEVFLAIQWG